MSVTFLHTADWQLGKPFASVRDEAKRHRLQQARLDAISNLATPIRESDAKFVLVAGDVFDSSQATKATVSAACAAIGSLQVPVIVIPGNHDHAGPGSIWEQPFFQREQQQLAPNLTVLLEPAPFVTDAAIIFPAPLRRRQDPDDPTAWIRAALDDPELPADLPRIILAHGSIHGFGATQEGDEEGASSSNFIDLARLPAGAFDYIALGDWHGTKQVGAAAWYSGTPEIDRFPKGEGNNPGNLLIVSVSRGMLPRVESRRSGQMVWKEIGFRFNSDNCLQRLSGHLDELVGVRGDSHLVMLRLEGSLGIKASAELEVLLDAWSARLLRLKLDRRVTIAPSEVEVSALTQRVQDPLVAEVARRLVEQMDGAGQEADTARLALRELHRCLAESGAF
jgi:DNA repair exonuclease SbcCD nuclease subunit